MEEGRGDEDNDDDEAIGPLIREGRGEEERKKGPAFGQTKHTDGTADRARRTHFAEGLHGRRRIRKRRRLAANQVDPKFRAMAEFSRRGTWP